MFMDSRNLRLEVETAKRFYSCHEEIFTREFSTSTKREHWLKFAASSSVLTLFSTFERKFSDAVASFTSFLDNHGISSYTEDAQKEHYKKAIKTLLSRLNWEKYDHLNELSVVTSYLNFLSENSAPRFTPEAVLVRDQNLRVDTVNEILSRIGLKSIEEWICHYQTIQARYEDVEVLRKFKSEWSDLLALRNDVAHGNLDDIPGSELLNDYVSLVVDFSSLIGEYLLHSAITLDTNNSVFKKVGQVSEYFTVPKAIILKMLKDSKLSEDQIVILLRTHEAKQSRVKSMRVKDVVVTEFMCQEDNTELGLKIEDEETVVKKGSVIYCLT
jgi:hypothetical protein